MEAATKITKAMTVGQRIQPVRSSLAGVVVISGVVFLASCETAPPPLSPPSGVIGRIPAGKSKLVVPRQQEVRFAENTITNVLPAGVYRPVAGNDAGVFYEAPSKIIERQTVAGMRIPDRPFTGGIFVERTNPQAAMIYEARSEIGAEGTPQHQPGKTFSPRDPIQLRLTRQ